jgi:hypothetical protein
MPADGVDINLAKTIVGERTPYGRAIGRAHYDTTLESSLLERSH